MIKRNVEFDGLKITMSCSALVPRLYRRACGRDLIVDMKNLREKYNASITAQLDLQKRAAEEGREIDPEELRAAQLSAIDLEVFENLAWAFVKDADIHGIPDTPDEWLNSLDGVFSVYKLFPIMCQIWNDSNKQTSDAAKK